jgi:nitroreductase
MVTKEEMLQYRTPQFSVGPLFINRWSPRAMSGGKIDHDMMMSLFEAARWAPSSYNNQPWRFIYARRDSEHWERLFGLLVDQNKAWAKNAAVLAVVISKKTFDFNGKPSRTHSYDAGAAWQNLALQGTAMGLVVHGMQGFDYDRAREELAVPDDYEVEAMFAAGKPGKKEDLPEAMQEQEFPSSRKSLDEIVHAGRFPVGEPAAEQG